MEVMIESKCSMSDLTRDLKIYPQLLENVKVSDKAVIMNDADVLAAVKEVEDVLGEDGRILLRESGTEPVIRVMVEAETDDICRKYVEQVVNVIKGKL
jgi:phosphoglucosamine mutase